MRIGLISDTHIPSEGKEPPPQVAQAFKGVDLILHAGDIYVDSCIEWLERIAPVTAIGSSRWGTGEGAGKVSVPQVIEAEGHSIGLVHGLWLEGISDEIMPGTIAKGFASGASLQGALVEIFGKPVDVVVFGFTHIAMIETHQGVLFVNPGATTLVGQVHKPGSVAILELTKETRQARIVQLAGLTG